MRLNLRRNQRKQFCFCLLSVQSMSHRESVTLTYFVYFVCSSQYNQGQMHPILAWDSSRLLSDSPPDCQNHEWMWGTYTVQPSWVKLNFMTENHMFNVYSFCFLTITICYCIPLPLPSGSYTGISSVVDNFWLYFSRMINLFSMLFSKL